MNLCSLWHVMHPVYVINVWREWGSSSDGEVLALNAPSTFFFVIISLLQRILLNYFFLLLLFLMTDMIQESFEKSEKLKKSFSTSFDLTIYLIENNANIAYVSMHKCQISDTILWYSYYELNFEVSLMVGFCE